DLLNVEARGPHQNTPVKLSSVASFEHRQGAVEISYDSLTPVFNVQLNLEGRDIGHAGAEIKQALKGLKAPVGLHWESKIDETSKQEITRLAKDRHNGCRCSELARICEDSLRETPGIRVWNRRTLVPFSAWELLFL